MIDSYYLRVVLIFLFSMAASPNGLPAEAGNFPAGLDKIEASINTVKPDPDFKDDLYGVIVVRDALISLKEGSGGIGACIVNEITGKVVARGRNRQYTPYFRSDLHAEMDLLTRYEDRLRKKGGSASGENPRICENLVLISSVEPCPMCLTRIINSGIKKMYYVVPDEKGGMVSRIDCLPPFWKERAHQCDYRQAECSPEVQKIAGDLFNFSMRIWSKKMKKKVIIYHAGSLSIPFEEMERIFEADNPTIDIVRRSGGSTKMARLISEQNEQADIMASADYTVIDKNLIPEKAICNIRFATNQLVLCYTDKSRHADKIDADNWYKILTRKDTVWGHSDPNLDPCGYRSLMVLQLAEIFYKKPGLYDRLIASRPMENVKPKAKQLVALLKSGEMDYGWEYLSVAVQNGLKYITLDDHINLGNYKYNNFYKKASVEVTGNRPGNVITRIGKSCTYGVTLINDAPNRKGAERFLEYLFSPGGGLSILKNMGQPPFIPCRVDSEKIKNSLGGKLSALVEVSN